MRCVIQWIDPLTGKLTPHNTDNDFHDSNEAVALVQPFDPRVPGTTKHEWVIPTPFVFSDAVARYAPVDGQILLPDSSGYAFPICAKHLDRKGPFWRALPLPGQDPKSLHAMVAVKQQPSIAVIETIINSWPDQAAAILKDLRYHGDFDRYWSFIRWGLFVGIEEDGYAHS